MLADIPELNTVDEHRSRDLFAAVVCPALRTSLREVSAEWTPRWPLASEGESSIEDTLMRLALRLDGVSDGNVVPEDGGRWETHDPRTEVRLLAAIRRDLLERWRRRDLAVDQDRLLELLHSIDHAEDHAEELVIGEAEDSEARPGEADAFRLVADVGHDLRSPLTSILFLSEAMRNGHSGSLTELQQHQLGLVYSAALGLMGVVNDLMSLAQDQASTDFEEEAAFSLPQTFEGVREMVAPMAEAKQIALRFAVHCSGHRVGHSGPLGRVLLNLTTNAIKFTGEGGSVEVLADSVARDDVEISVRDTGRGISPEQRARLFQPFQKSPGRQGFFFAPSGLGLSIVQRLLEKMDSELTMESELGQGTRFSFILRLPSCFPSQSRLPVVRR